MITGG